jgi:hypothetical protein
MIIVPPATTNFFTNKIQSTQPDFPDYLIAVAEVFSHFDGLPYDRASIVDEFGNLSNRGPYITRDPSDFRDEYSAYGTYLGIFYVERQGDIWVTRLTNAARHFLCSTEPDPGAFCRVQLALFQYPLGLGVSYTPNGRPTRVQSNALRETVQDVERGVRLVPLRVILRAFLALIDQGQEPLTARLTYHAIFHLFNNPLCYESNPSSSAEFAAAVQAAMDTPLPPDLDLGYFKRNFHILEQMSRALGKCTRGAEQNCTTERRSMSMKVS